MNEPQLRNYIQILLFLAFVIPAIIFFLAQQRTLQAIRPVNRRMPPGQVWFQLIPIVGLIWQFFVIRRISDSIRNELNTPIDDSIFAETTIPAGHRPAYNVGILYSSLYCTSVIPHSPLLKCIIALPGMVAWITYWVQLSRYKKQIKERALLLNS